MGTRGINSRANDEHARNQQPRKHEKRNNNDEHARNQQPRKQAVS